ncbi:MAG TPA: PHP domain-containing protein [Longimicrobiales bacterium]
MATPRTLRVELHCHTVHSHDGHITYDGLVRTARRRGIDVVAITDHDTLEGALEFRRRARRDGIALEVIVGEERTLRDGSHVIGLFLEEPIRSDTLGEAVREIAAQGGACVLPHPFRRRDGVCRDGVFGPDSARDGGCRDAGPGAGASPAAVVRDALRAAAGAPVAFEIFNPKCSLEENRRARDLLASGMGVVGGSDAHFEADLGECINVMAHETDARTSVRRALERAGRVRVLGVPQRPGSSGREYAPLYYRIKPYVRVPRPLVPAANRLYRAYVNGIARRTVGPLEEKYAAHEEGD